MSNLFEPRYVLAVNNLANSKQFYQNKLGFDLLNEYPGWAFLRRDNVTIMLGECRDEAPASEIGDHSYFAYIEIHNAEILFNEYNNNDVNFIKPLKDEPWGMREFGIVTIDGHRIMFGQNMDE